MHWSYDLICLEGPSQALHIFIRKYEIPEYKVMDLPISSILKMHRKPETSLA